MKQGAAWLGTARHGWARHGKATEVPVLLMVSKGLKMPEMVAKKSSIPDRVFTWDSWMDLLDKIGAMRAAISELSDETARKMLRKHLEEIIKALNKSELI